MYVYINIDVAAFYDKMLNNRWGKVYFRFNTHWSSMRDRGNKEYNNIKSIILVGQSAVLPRAQASKPSNADNQFDFN